MRLLPLCFLTMLALAGCQSISDIDLSAKDPDCTQVCLSRHQLCDSRITLMPIRKHNDCADNLRYCVQDCPAKGAAKPASDIVPAIQAKAMQDAKAKCVDLGFKVGTDSFGQCVLKLTK